MKLASLLSRISAATSAGALALAFFASSPALTFTLLAISAVAFVVLIAARDYAPRARRWEPALVASHKPAIRHGQRLRLAA